MRARQPDRSGYVEREGVKLFYEVYGSGALTLLLLPAWSIIHSRMWKAQIPYLARHYRVVTFDGRGNGRSDRPKVPRPIIRANSSPMPSRSWMRPTRHALSWSASPRAAISRPCSRRAIPTVSTAPS